MRSSVLVLITLSAGIFAGCNCGHVGGPDGGSGGGSGGGAGGGAGGGGGSDGGACAPSTGASTWPQRTECDLLGPWTISMVSDPAWDAGGFSPCLPLPALGRSMSIGQELGTFTTSPDFFVHWMEDAGCSLQLDYSFSSSNPSETYCHAVSLQLNLVDVGELFGNGTYQLSGGSNCTGPVIGDVRR